MRYAEEFETFLRSVRGHSAATVRTYARALLDFERTVEISDPAAVTIRDLDRYLTRVWLRGLGAATRRTRVHALRSFFRFLSTRDFIPADPSLELRAPSVYAARVPTLTEAEITRLIFEVVQPDVPRLKRDNDLSFSRRKRVAGARFFRDSALLAVGYDLALRAHEYGLLRREDYRTDARGVSTVALRGKGAREPTILRVDRKVAAILDTWLFARMECPGGEHPALFSSLGPARRDDAAGLSPQRVAEILAERIALAKIEARGRRLSPHALRYTRASHLYAAGVKLLEISVLLRHRSIETTARYIRLGNRAAIERIGIASLPWNSGAAPLARALRREPEPPESA